VILSIRAIAVSDAEFSTRLSDILSEPAAD